MQVKIIKTYFEWNGTQIIIIRQIAVDIYFPPILYLG